jgi:hypothetical protein
LADLKVVWHSSHCFTITPEEEEEEVLLVITVDAAAGAGEVGAPAAAGLGLITGAVGVAVTVKLLELPRVVLLLLVFVIISLLLTVIGAPGTQQGVFGSSIGGRGCGGGSLGRLTTCWVVVLGNCSLSSFLISPLAMFITAAGGFEDVLGAVCVGACRGNGLWTAEGLSTSLKAPSVPTPTLVAAVWVTTSLLT